MRSRIVGNSTLLLGLLTLTLSYGDTITTLDHLSVNGLLKRMSDGTITLEARYASGSKTLMIPISRVETIEFNSTGFNPGAPPKVYGLGPGVSSTPRLSPPQQSVVADTIELRGAGGERQPCKVVSIDDNSVHCDVSSTPKDKKPSEYARRIVLRILVRRGR